MENNTLSDNELQEKALYNNIQYLPLEKLGIKEGNDINTIIKNAESNNKLSESERAAVEQQLPAIKKLLEDRPELGEATISNMSWEDRNSDGKPDHEPKAMQAAVFEFDGHACVSFRGTPSWSWTDNGKAFAKDDKLGQILFDVQMGLGVGLMSGPFAVAAYGVNAYNKDKMPEGREFQNVYGMEIYEYTSRVQEYSIAYMEELINPPDGKRSIFDKYETVDITGHSKGGNEAMLITTLYSDRINRCISMDGQGFSPEFVEYVKSTVGESKFKEIQEKMYGYCADNDFVHATGVSILKEENIIYFKPTLDILTLMDLVKNHYPTAMISLETGKMAERSEKGPIAKFISLINEELMALDEGQRRAVALMVMGFFQYGYAKSPSEFRDPRDFGFDVISTLGGVVFGTGPLLGMIIKGLATKEGEELLKYLYNNFREDIVEILGKLAAGSMKKLLNDLSGNKMGYIFDWLNGDEAVKDAVRKLFGEGLKEQLIFGTKAQEAVTVNYDKKKEFTEQSEGVVAINYDRAKELVAQIENVNTLVDMRLKPEIRYVIESLGRLKYWRVSTRELEDLEYELDKDNESRMRFRERVINYYRKCEDMEQKFIAALNMG